MRLCFSLVTVAALSTALAAHADTYKFVYNDGLNSPATFTLNSNPTPSSYTSQTFTIENVSITQGGVVYNNEEVEFADFGTLTGFGYGTSVDLTPLGGTATGPGPAEGSIFGNCVLFTGSTSAPTLQLGSLQGGELVVTDTATAISPEPSSLLLLGTGLVGGLGMLRRRFA